jgi:hypothetical protein
VLQYSDHMVLFLLSTFAIHLSWIFSNEEFSSTALARKLSCLPLLFLQFSLLVLKLSSRTPDLRVKVGKVSVCIVDFAFEGIDLIWEIININGGIVYVVYFITEILIVFL